MTRRQELIKLLEQGEWSLQHLANHFKLSVAELLPDFYHIKRTIKPRQIVVKPAVCRNCGYVFRERSKISKPSKCPKCKSEWIESQRYTIR